MLRTLKKKNSNYYGSPLNRFIDEFCSHEMTCNNIDCILLKVAKHRIRVIESKHGFETMPKSQLTALKILKYLLNESKSKGWQIEFFAVSGDYPYRSGATIFELGSNKSYQIDQQKLIRWLNFEEEL